MDDVFNCGHPRTADNTVYRYGYKYCLQCKRRSNREHMRRKRREYVEKYGYATARPDSK